MKLEKVINMEEKCITTSFKLADKVNHLAKMEAFISLKDHKGNVTNKLTCRLLNPTKNELGKTSKQLIEEINKELLEN